MVEGSSFPNFGSVEGTRSSLTERLAGVDFPLRYNSICPFFLEKEPRHLRRPYTTQSEGGKTNR